MKKWIIGVTVLLTVSVVLARRPANPGSLILPADDLGWQDMEGTIDTAVVEPGVTDNKLNYSFLYFENGYPTPQSSYRRPQSEANTAARANPDLVVQTGYYSLMLDCDDMEIKGYDALAGSDYLTALHEDVTVFTPATLTLSATVGGTSYTCTSAAAQNSTNQLVRLIQSNRFVQRFDHLGLVFKDGSGNVLNAETRLEVTAWADRVAIKLDFSGVSGVTQTKVSLLSPAAVLHETVSAGDEAVLAVQPHLDATVPAWSVGSYVTDAYNRDTLAALSTRFDEDEYALYIDVPASSVSYPADLDRVDEYVIEVTNPGAGAQNLPLVFDQTTPRAITGTIMTMCEEADGRPVGIPVQISKNWHKDAANPTVHEGSWLRGYTMLHLAPGETRQFRLRVIYGYWGGAGAISHSQLSLIGWGKNWKWDESALGAWGESFTYDPCLHAGVAFMDDIRPTFTTPMNSGTDHNWTENSGGGDYLIYRDSSNKYRWIKRLKTAYLWTGPNMTEVLYSGTTDDDKIRVTYSSRAVRTSDYHRRFHGYKYEFLQNVTSPERLVFHQMAADYYTGPTFTNYYRGDITGLLAADVADVGGNTYKGTPVVFNNQWLSIDDGMSYDKVSRSRRGILNMSSTLNGSAFPLYMHTYGRSWGTDRLMFDFSADSVERSYSAGDVVEGEFEFIMPPKSAGDYWGSDAELIGRLGAYGTNAWQAVYDEMRYNLDVAVTVNTGTLLRNYPVEVQAYTNSGTVVADLTISAGGIGHVPVVVRGLAPGQELAAQRYSNGSWVNLESVDLVGHNYYQGYRNADGTMDCVFNISRPSLDLNAAWRIRIISEIPKATLLAHWGLDDGAGSVARDLSANGYDGTVVDGTWVSGINGGALQFNGSSTQVSLPVSAFSAVNNEVTVAMWVYGGAAQPRDDTVFFAKNAAGKRVLNIHLPWSSSSVYWDAGFSGTTYDRINKTANAADFMGGWNHWVFTKNAETGEMNIYLNGAPWHSGTGKTKSMSGITAAAIGSQTSGMYYDGLIDDVRLYGVELTAGEVADLYIQSQDTNNYAAWAWGYSLTDTNADWDADADGDTLNNLGEYALGGNPTNAADIGYIPSAGMTSSRLDYVHARRIGSEGELDYSLECSTNLVSGIWTNAGYVVLPVTGNLDADYEAVTNRIDITGKTNEFIRLKIQAL